jgi:hypothetical protein
LVIPKKPRVNRTGKKEKEKEASKKKQAKDQMALHVSFSSNR